MSVENGKQDEFMKCIIPEIDEPFWVSPPWSSNSGAVVLLGNSALICCKPDAIEIPGAVLLLPPLPALFALLPLAALLAPHPPDKMHKPKIAESETQTFMVELFP